MQAMVALACGAIAVLNRDLDGNFENHAASKR